MEYPNKNLQELIEIEQAKLKRSEGFEDAALLSQPTFLQVFGLEKVASKVKELTRI